MGILGRLHSGYVYRCGGVVTVRSGEQALGGNMSWRKHSRMIIEGIVAEYGTDDLEALEKEIRISYPFHARKGYAYKAWLKEVKHVMGILREGGRIYDTPDSVKYFWVSKED